MLYVGGVILCVRRRGDVIRRRGAVIRRRGDVIRWRGDVIRRRVAPRRRLWPTGRRCCGSSAWS